MFGRIRSMLVNTSPVPPTNGTPAPSGNVAIDMEPTAQPHHPIAVVFRPLSGADPLLACASAPTNNTPMDSLLNVPCVQRAQFVQQPNNMPEVQTGVEYQPRTNLVGASQAASFPEQKVGLSLFNLSADPNENTKFTPSRSSLDANVSQLPSGDAIVEITPPSCNSFSLDVCSGIPIGTQVTFQTSELLVDEIIS